ncbi:MAG: hypothetical protein KAR20_21055 [Candidatus Heimdallarchaeota archaeon]|nr:hypothetical protein [Candidatus Heimdallarchaeota archaeon]
MCNKPICTCVHCQTPIFDTDKLNGYIGNLKKLIDGQKNLIQVWIDKGDIPPESMPRLLKHLEVKYAEATNQKAKLEVTHDSEDLSRNERAENDI